ncbi:MAG: MEDS domain-containing protein [Burkholderiales bacterium]
MDQNWPELLQYPTPGDHFVQVYQDQTFLCEAVAEYVGSGLKQGEGVMLIARPAHVAAFSQHLERAGVSPDKALHSKQLVLLDADETLARFTPGGMPDWQTFHALIGGRIAEMRLSFPTVRAYGEMVDVLWQRGERDAAIRLEEFWNDLGRLQTFSLLCAYYIDNLDPQAYSGPLECICKVHTHLIPTPDYSLFNQAVLEASEKVLDVPLSQMLLSLTASSKPAAAMPDGQATLLWLKRNMPRTADKVLAEVRARCAAAGA